VADFSCLPGLTDFWVLPDSERRVLDGTVKNNLGAV